MEEKRFKGKKILFYIPEDYDIHEIFKYNFKVLEFDKIKIIASPNTFKYKNLYDKIFNFFYKIFTNGSKAYKQELIRKSNTQFILQHINDIEKESYDYVFIIRADRITKEGLETLLSKAKKKIAYQWDGLNRFSKIFDYIPYFDKFYAFQEEDYIKYKDKYPNLYWTSNFYFDEELPYKITKNIPKLEVFYIGSNIEERLGEIEKIITILDKINVSKYIRIVGKSKKEYDNIVFLENFIPFSENIQRVKNANVLLDFKVKEHNGLSLRFFEAIKYQKKIITNNKYVKNYDFYTPENIFIIDEDEISSLEKFIKSPYKEISQDIVKKYSFSNWLKCCLE